MSLPGIKFVLSYRRSDAPGMTGWIFERLTQHYGDGKVFRDVDSIPFGLDFRKHIRKELDQCNALIAIIGPRWLGESGRQRIHDGTDFVRFEIETALRRGIPVVPVLVEGATMLRPDQLPETLQDFAFYNAAEVDSGRDFRVHVERLIRSLDRLLAAKAAAEELLLSARPAEPERKVADTYFMQGETYRLKGEYDRAIADLSEAIRLDPKYVRAYAGRGDVYRLKGEYDRAIADLDQAIRLDPKHAWAYANRGEAYENKGDLDRAIADYEAALAIDPKHSDALAGRDRAQRARGARRRS